MLERIIAADPGQAWDRLAGLLSDLNSIRAIRIQSWLAGPHGFGNDKTGPILLLPSERVWRWADQKPAERAAWLAGTMPRTLDQCRAGRLTKEFLSRYGTIKKVARNLMLHFYYYVGWCGSEAEHYRHRRERAQNWLAAETEQPIVEWLTEYIRWLDHDIRKAELEEERD